MTMVRFLEQISEVNEVSMRDALLKVFLKDPATLELDESCTERLEHGSDPALDMALYLGTHVCPEASVWECTCELWAHRDNYPGYDFVTWRLT